MLTLAEKNGWVWPRQSLAAKTSWGPQGWHWLHTLAIDFPEAPSDRDWGAAVARITAFISNLPCPECREHAKKYIQTHPPALDSSLALQNWVWTFHNAVNRRLGKPEMEYAAYRRAYSKEIERAELAATFSRRSRAATFSGRPRY